MAAGGSTAVCACACALRVRGEQRRSAVHVCRVAGIDVPLVAAFLRRLYLHGHGCLQRTCITAYTGFGFVSRDHVSNCNGLQPLRDHAGLCACTVLTSSRSEDRHTHILTGRSQC